MKKYYEEETFESNEGIQWENSEFLNCAFIGLDLSELSLKNSQVLESRFDKCNLSNINLLGTSFREVSFKDCKLVGLSWAQVRTFFDASFENCVLNYSQFQEMSLSGLKFKNCTMRDMDFRECNLEESSFSHCDLLNTSFNRCNFSGSDFRNAKSYRLNPLSEKLKGAKFDLPEALVLFEEMGIEVLENL